MAARKRRFFPDGSASAPSASFDARRAIVASAAKIDLGDRKVVDQERLRASAQFAWQQAAWDHYNAIGEISYGFNLLADVLSRLRLFPAFVARLDEPPTELSEAAGIDDAETGPAGLLDDEGDAAARKTDLDPRDARTAAQVFDEAMAGVKVSELCRAFALNISVPGECHLARVDGRWGVYSTTELMMDTQGLRHRRSIASDPTPVYLPKDTPLGRIWRQGGQYSADPNSSMRALEEACDELRLLGHMIRAAARSRLNAGLLFIPEEIDIAATRPADDVGAEEEQRESFVQELIYGLTEPVRDESAAAGVVPTLLRGPGELGKLISHISLAREGDQYLVERADRVLDRILQGISLPKDLVTGLANVRYSNALVIDDGLYKAHIEPLALILVDAFTEIAYRPALLAAGMDEATARKIVVWYDPSEIVVRPNRSADADAGYGRGVLSARAWRDAHGFGDSDAPDEEETARRLAWEKAAIPPEIATALLQTLLPNVLGAARDAALETAPFPDSLSDVLGDRSPAPPSPPGTGLSESLGGTDPGPGDPETTPNGSLPPRQIVPA